MKIFLAAAILAVSPCLGAKTVVQRRLQGVTESELAAANSSDKCWLQIDSDAYDVTSYAPTHPSPGGASSIFAQCGNDVTTEFYAQSSHSSALLALVTNLGPVSADPGVTSTQLAAANTPSNCWLQIDSDAYDVTAYAPNHPSSGGSASIFAQCGNDVTTEFYAEISHSSAILALVTNLGPVTNVGTPAPIAPPTPAPVAPTPAPIVAATQAPVVPVTPAPAVPATQAPFVPATPAPIVPATPAPVVTLSVGVTSSQLAAANSPENCWLQIDSDAYDVTAYAPTHPVGSASIFAQCGNDVTTEFYDEISHSSVLLAMVTNLGPVTAVATPATPAPVVPLTPAPIVVSTPAPVVPATPAPVVSATPAPGASATPAPVVLATLAPVTPATPSPVVPVTLAPVVPATPAPVISFFLTGQTACNGVTRFTLEEVQSSSDCLMILYDKVFDLTTYSHPGPQSDITKNCNTDGTIEYEDEHDENLLRLIADFQVGMVMNGSDDTCGDGSYLAFIPPGDDDDDDDDSGSGSDSSDSDSDSDEESGGNTNCRGRKKCKKSKRHTRGSNQHH